MVKAMQEEIIKLQEIVSHQQDEITALGEELYKQQKEINELRRVVMKLKNQQEQASADGEAAETASERPPPHY
ncbi:MAG: SlyX family protein [Alphaproteobacteria bacterium]|nr:SlyX family protein [Alphaproteobacteria bacterium]